MSRQYDVIIIGGGHNGLTCAAYLARAGRKVLVLEAAGQLGGLGATREFFPGFKASVAHTLPQLNKRLVQDLDLENHGFTLARSSLDTIALSGDGRHIRIGDGQVHGASAADSSAYVEYVQLMERFASALKPFWHKRPPMVGSGQLSDISTLGQFAWKLRTLGKIDMREMMRMIALPAWDLMEEFFEDPLLQAALSWDANLGSKLAPRSPNNAVLALLYRMSGDIGAQPLPVGTVGGLTEALASAARHHGAEIRVDSPVSSIVVDNRAAVGVELNSGELLTGAIIASNADPKTTFMDLLGPRHLDVQFTHRINRLRMEGMVAKLHLALDGAPVFNNLGSADGRLIIAPSMQAIEDAYDHAKYGELAPQLPLEVIVPSLYDDSVAPQGKHVVSVHIQYAPYHARGGWDTLRNQLLGDVLHTLEHHAPNICDQIKASELLTPQDLEQQYRVRGGHWHHGEFAIDNWWMNRPTYGASQYKTPVHGLYLCGAGAHPGGGIMGAAGSNAAEAILQER